MKSLAFAFALFVSVNSARAELIAGFDFQTTATGGTAIAADPKTPTLFNANFGSGQLFLNGASGSSEWVTDTKDNELTAYSGTAENAAPGFATGTTSPAALAIQGGLGQGADGKGMVFALSMSGHKSLVLTYAAQKTSSGFDSHEWFYSTDGVRYTQFLLISEIPARFATLTVDFSTVTALDNAPKIFLKLIPSGSMTSSGNNRLDNFQFNATPVP